MPENFCSKAPSVAHAVLEILDEEYKGEFNDLISQCVWHMAWYAQPGLPMRLLSSPCLLAYSRCRPRTYPAALNRIS
jgi:hypothetical protein